MKARPMPGRGLTETEAFKGLPLYLFVGVAALLVSPFLTWFNYGLNLDYPSQVSLVWLFERGFRIDLALYLLGVACGLAVTAKARKPVALLGVFPAAFPVFILAATLGTFFDGSMGYAQAFTVGTFAALLGSALMESSYFAYQRSFAKFSRFNR